MPVTPCQAKLASYKKGNVIQSEPKENTRRQRVRSVEFGLTVLKALADIGGGASITALSVELGENPAKIHRYLASLIESGFVYQDATTGHYVLGLEATLVGIAAVRRSDVLTLASTAMTELAEALDIACFIAVLGNMGPTIVRWEEPIHPVTVNVRVGSVLPLLWSATGRVFAAFAKAKSIETFIQQDLKAANSTQRKEISSKKSAQALFEAIRSAGCASVRGTLLSGVSAVAAPIFDHNGNIKAVITALGVTENIDVSPSGKVALAVKQKALEVSTALGHRP